ncbi:MAG: tetratricopeptide repeat protein [Acidobacteriota bacterium]
MANLRTWLLRLTYNVCMDLHRERKRRGEESLDEVGENSLRSTSGSAIVREENDPEYNYLAGELSLFLERSIEALPSKLQDPLRMRIRSSSYREIADHLAISQAAARKRIQLARRILRDRLEEYRTGNAGPARRGPSRDPGGVRGDLENRPGPVASTWSIRAFRAASVESAAGRRKDIVVAFHEPVRRPTERRRMALEKYNHDHQRGWKGHLELARLLVEAGEPAEAIPHYRKVVERQPRRLDAWLELASALELMDRAAEAVEILTRAGRLLKRNEHYLRALSAKTRGRTAAAIEALGDARASTPEDTAPLVALGQVYWEAGQATKAKDAFDSALAIDPDDLGALTLSHGPLEAIGLTLEAYRRVSRALEIDGGNHLALVHWLGHRCRSGDFAGRRGQSVRSRLKAAKRLAGQRADVVRCQSAFELARGERSWALRDLVEVQPWNPEGWLHYSRFLHSEGENLKAAHSLAKVDLGLTAGAERRRMALQVCRLLPSVTAAPNAAGRYLDDILGMMPNDPLVIAAVAWGLARLDTEPARSRELARRATEISPELGAVWFSLGRVLVRQGDAVGAISALEEGWRRRPSIDDGYLLSTPAALLLGAAYGRLGRRSSSLHWYAVADAHAQGATAVDPSCSRLWRALAQAGLDAGPTRGLEIHNLQVHPVSRAGTSKTFLSWPASDWREEALDLDGVLR